MIYNWKLWYLKADNILKLVGFVTGLFADTLNFLSASSFSSYPYVRNVEEFILVQYTMDSIYLWYVLCFTVIEFRWFSGKFRFLILTIIYHLYIDTSNILKGHQTAKTFFIYLIQKEVIFFFNITLSFIHFYWIEIF